MDPDLTAPFAVFDEQDSGCVSYGVVHEGERLLVKVATTLEAAATLRRAAEVHASVRHPAIVAPLEVQDRGDDHARVIYPWHDGEVLKAATSRGSDRSGGVIDERTTVFGLGRTLHHLLDHPDGWRGTARERAVIARATDPEPCGRFASVADLVGAWHPGPQRIAVVGTGGSGKTTLARRLGRSLDLPHLELDAVFHQAGWEPLPDEEFRDRVRQFCAGDRWVTCGKYAVVRDLLFERADTIVCLDHGRLRQTARVWWRSLRRYVTREELWNGNRESLRGLWPFGPPEQTLTRWVWVGVPRARALFDRLAADPPGGAVVVRLRGWREIERYARQLEGGTVPRSAETTAPG